MIRIGADVLHLLRHIGVDGLRYVEFYLEHRAVVASLRWSLVSDTDRALYEARGTLPQLPKMGIEVPTVTEPSQAVRLPLIGSTQRFASVRVGQSAATVAEKATIMEQVEPAEAAAGGGATVLPLLGSTHRFSSGKRIG